MIELNNEPMSKYKFLQIISDEKRKELSASILAHVAEYKSPTRTAEHFHVRRSIVTMIQEKNGLFNKGAFKKASAEKIQAYKEYVDGCAARLEKPKRAREWVVEYDASHSNFSTNNDNAVRDAARNNDNDDENNDNDDNENNDNNVDRHCPDDQLLNESDDDFASLTPRETRDPAIKAATDHIIAAASQKGESPLYSVNKIHALSFMLSDKRIAKALEQISNEMFNGNNGSITIRFVKGISTDITITSSV